MTCYKGSERVCRLRRSVALIGFLFAYDAQVMVEVLLNYTVTISGTGSTALWVMGVNDTFYAPVIALREAVFPDWSGGGGAWILLVLYAFVYSCGVGILLAGGHALAGVLRGAGEKREPDK